MAVTRRNAALLEPWGLSIEIGATRVHAHYSRSSHENLCDAGIPRAA